MKLFLIALSALVLGSCASSKVLENKAAPGVDLSSYKTFDFYKVTPQGDTMRGRFTENAIKMQNAIAAEMEKRGFTRSSDNPDMLINIGMVLKDTVQTRETNFVTDAPRYMGTRNYSWQAGEVVVGHYKIGTATIEMVDTKKNEMVWVGTVQDIVPEKQSKVDEAIKNGIAYLFKKFPVQPKA